jgi:hypothetical protein
MEIWITAVRRIESDPPDATVLELTDEGEIVPAGTRST